VSVALGEIVLYEREQDRRVVVGLFCNTNLVQWHPMLNTMSTGQWLVMHLIRERAGKWTKLVKSFEDFNKLQFNRPISEKSVYYSKLED
jgi:hypothetical protein